MLVNVEKRANKFDLMFEEKSDPIKTKIIKSVEVNVVIFLIRLKFFSKNRAIMFKRFKFKSISKRIFKEHCFLFAGQAFKSNIWLDYKINSL